MRIKRGCEIARVKLSGLYCNIFLSGVLIMLQEVLNWFVANGLILKPQRVGKTVSQLI